jgi:hypothetical protein
MRLDWMVNDGKERDLEAEKEGSRDDPRRWTPQVRGEAGSRRERELREADPDMVFFDSRAEY